MRGSLKQLKMRLSVFSPPLAALSLSVMMMNDVQAVHPLVTDDTGTQDQGNSQIELNTDHIRSAGVRSRVAAFTYTYGIRSNVDVFGNLPATLSGPSGMNDAALGIKWRFWKNEQTSLALKPELILATGDESKQLGNGRTSGALTLLASSEHAPWTFHGNIGVQVNNYRSAVLRDANQRLLWRVSAAAVYEVTPQVNLLADIGASRNIEKTIRTNPAFFLVGLIYAPTKKVDVDAGLKFGLKAAEADRQFGVGITYRF